jgi:hypothetical protein
MYFDFLLKNSPYDAARKTWIVWILCLIIVLAVALNSPLLAPWFFIGLLAVGIPLQFLVFQIECSNCGKHPQFLEFAEWRIGSVPLLGWPRPWPETVCSKCGADLTICMDES